MPMAPRARFAPLPMSMDPRARLGVVNVAERPAPMPLQPAQAPQQAAVPSQPPAAQESDGGLLSLPYRPRGGILGADPLVAEPSGGILGGNPLAMAGLALSALGDAASGGETNALGDSLNTLLAMQKMRAEQYGKPGDYLKEINDQLIDLRTGEVVGDYRTEDGPKRDLFTVKQGDTEFTVIGDKSDPTTWKNVASAPRYRPNNSTTVNIAGDETESEFDKVFGRIMGEQAAGIYSESDRAAAQLARMDRLEALVDQWQSSGGSLGPLATTQENATAWAQSLGIDPGALGLPEDAGPAQAIRAIGNEMALGKIGGEDGMPANNFSDADRKFVTSTVPQLTDVAEGLRLKIEATRRGAERAREKERLWSEAEAQGKTYREFRREWADYVNANPLFSEEEKKAVERGAGDGGAATFDGWTIEEVTE